MQISIQVLFTYLILVPLAANYWANWSGLYQKFDKWLFRRIWGKDVKWRILDFIDPRVKFFMKLISCSLCLSAHITWISLLLSGNRNIFEIIILSFASGSVAYLTSKL
jgi:hypothetical protein